MAKTTTTFLGFAEYADDFFLNILLLKSVDPENFSIPFMHGHILELSVKALCLKQNIDYKDIGGHNILDIYKRVSLTYSEIIPLLPTTEHFNEYKRIWVSVKIKNTNITLPNPEILYYLELAYFMDNVMNLKYGFTKDLVLVSSVKIDYKKINSKFLKLFNFCRDIYKNHELNEKFKSKCLTIFGNDSGVQTGLQSLVNL